MESFCYSKTVDIATIILSEERVSIFWDGIYISNLLTILGLISTAFRFVVNKHIYLKNDTAN